MNHIAKSAHQPSRFFGFTQLFDLLRSSSIADGVVQASIDENWYIVAGGDNKNSV